MPAAAFLGGPFGNAPTSQTEGMELHFTPALRTSAISDEAAEGTVVAIENDGMPVAEIRPVRRVPPKEAVRKLKALWDSLPQVKADSGKFLEEDR